MKEKNYCIIMAGGIGSRFWPLSKDNYPKQFLDILGTGKSFIRATYERFSPLIPDSNFLIVTNAAYKELVLQHLPELTPDQVLCEPARRNTAPCIAYAAYRIQSQCADARIVVTPSDALVTNETEFHNIINLGFDFLQQKEHHNDLLTISIKPSRPETGYGYIHISDTDKGQPVVKVEAFKEKPDLDTAKEFLRMGGYFWNAGIFLWTLDGIMNALKEYLPDIVNNFNQGIGVFGTEKEQEFINKHFLECPNISIDYGVMEKSPRTYTIPADFGWSDIGTWGSLFTFAHKDEHDNAVTGRVVSVDNSNSVISIEDGTEAIVQGLDSYLVAYRDNSLLVCRLKDEQSIKIWCEDLKK